MKHIFSSFFILVFCHVYFPLTANAQTGMFGKKNSFEIGMMTAPTIKSKSTLVTAGADTVVEESFRIINTSFFFKYNRIISNRITASVGLLSTNVRSTAKSVDFAVPFGNQGDFLITNNDITEMFYRHHALEIGLDYFIEPALNPLGLYFSFDAEFGIANVDYSLVSTFERGPTGIDNSFPAFNFSENHVLSNTSKQYFTTFMRLSVGKKIVLSRSLTINFEGGGNILSFISTDESNNLSAFKIVDGLDFSSRVSLSDLSDQSFVSNTLAGIKAYKRMFFNVSASYYF